MSNSFHADKFMVCIELLCVLMGRGQTEHHSFLHSFQSGWLQRYAAGGERFRLFLSDESLKSVNHFFFFLTRFRLGLESKGNAGLNTPLVTVYLGLNSGRSV